MPYGSASVFDINLLKEPGLQGVGAEVGLGLPDHEEAIIDRLQSRADPSRAASKVQLQKKSKSRRWVVLSLLILAAAAYWGYQEGYLVRLRSLIPVVRFSQPALPVPPVAKLPQGTCAKVLADFLDQLPARATVDFMAAGMGMFIYRIWGEDLKTVLPQLNAKVVGYQYGDVIGPIADGTPGYWLGTVAYASQERTGALRPVEAEYDRFFTRLQDHIKSSGGAIVEMIPGTMKAGEYVIRGSLVEIEAHLVEITQVVASAHYHRMSLLRQDEPSIEAYLLRVIFNITEGTTASPLLSSQGATGA